jgi:hypothetical protein
MKLNILPLTRFTYNGSHRVMFLKIELFIVATVKTSSPTKMRIYEVETSQSHFTIGGVQPIIFSWRQALSDSRAEIFFFQLNPCDKCPYVISSLTRIWVCLLRICLTFRQAYVSHLQHGTENSSFCTIQSDSSGVNATYGDHF